MEEVWKDIPGFEGYYEASTDGNIKSVDRIINCPWGKVYPAKGKPNSVWIDRYGYPYVVLSKEHKNYHRTVHRIVALTFIPNPENKPCIDHIDGDKTNNHVENLRWCTVKENNRNPITLQRHKEMVFTEERNRKISHKLKGHVCSQETRNKISEKKKLYYQKLKLNGTESNSSC